MFRTVQLSFGALGLLLAFGADRLSMPVLFYGALVCFGFMALAIGSEAIAMREIVLGSRRRGGRFTYVGVPAVLQGIQINLLGIFLIWLAAFTYLRGEASGREIFLQFVRRPGLLLVTIGILLLMQAVIMSWGSLEAKNDKGGMAVVSFLFTRLFPGIVLTVLGIGVLGLGLFEIAAPVAFDEMGGGFLEMLYGLR